MDLLERGKAEAIGLMLNLPSDEPTAELDFTNIDDCETWLGLGWLVAKGWVAYRGGGCFSFAKDGRRLASNYVSE